jgi:hypothetical protein
VKPALSPAREALRAAIAASAVVDPRGERIAQMIAAAEVRERDAEMALEACHENDKQRLQEWLDGNASGDRPQPDDAARESAQRELDQARRSLALARQTQADHAETMKPVHAAAARAAQQIGPLTLDVLCEEAETIIRELASRLRHASNLAIRIEGLRMRCKELADAGIGGTAGYRLTERLQALMAGAQRGRIVAIRGITSFDPPIRKSIQVWARAADVVAGDPQADLTSLIESITGD